MLQIIDGLLWVFLVVVNLLGYFWGRELSRIYLLQYSWFWLIWGLDRFLSLSSGLRIGLWAVGVGGSLALAWWESAHSPKNRPSLWTLWVLGTFLLALTVYLFIWRL